MRMIEVLVGWVLANMLAIIVVLGISALIGMYAWPYAINTWLVFAGKAPCVEASHGALLGLVPGLGYLSIPAAAITWVAMLFLV